MEITQIGSLTREYKYKIELHAHTAPVSGCSEISPEEMVRSYKQEGYDAIVITNHYVAYAFENFSDDAQAVEYYLSGYRETAKFGEKYGLKVILGLETRYPECANDYLVYGVTEQDVKEMYPSLKRSYPEFYKRFRSENRVILQAHPFRDGMVLQDPELLDGIEIFNCHPGHNSRIGVAGKYAAQHSDFIVMGGSDFHHPGMQGMCCALTRRLPEDSVDLAKILRAGDYLLEIGNSVILPQNARV